MTVRAALTAGICAVVLSAAGCGAQTGDPKLTGAGNSPVPTSSAARVVPPKHVPHDACADDPGVAAAGHAPTHPRWQRQPLPATFEPVLLITCDTAERRYPHDGEWTVRIEKRATQGLAAVVAKIRSTPPPPPTGEYACALALISDPWFLLVDRAGRVVLPVIPHSRDCDQPIDVGLRALHYTVVSTKRVQQQATAAELASGCADRWKNMPRLVADDHNSHPATSRVVSARPVSVCTYRATREDPEVGDFAGGLRFTDSQARDIGRLMHADPPDVGVMCAPVDYYAVVHTAGYAETYVDLSGCEAMYVDEGQTWTSPVPDLVRAIKKLPLRR